MRGAACTGAGVLQEKNERLGDTLNARTFALAERSGLPLMTICSTCQGVMSQANKRADGEPGLPGRDQRRPGRGRDGVSRHG